MGRDVDGETKTRQFDQLAFGSLRMGGPQFGGVPVDDRQLVGGGSMPFNDLETDARRQHPLRDRQPFRDAHAHPRPRRTEPRVEPHERLIGVEQGNGAHPIVAQQDRHALLRDATPRGQPEVLKGWLRG